MPMKCRPQKWLLYAPLAVLPFLAAWILNSKPLQQDIAARVAANLVIAESGWAKTAIAGRDAVLLGDAPSAEAMQRAIQAVAGTFGVRRVDSKARVVEPPPPPPPAVELESKPSRPLGDGGRATIKSFVPGKIVVDTVAPAAPNIAPLSPKSGTFEASGNEASGNEASGNEASGNEASGNLVIAAAPESSPEPAPPPPAMPAPTVKVSAVTIARPTISGTWSQSADASLSVSLAGTTYVLGTDETLISANSGTWSLTLPRPLKDGVYDVAVETADASGNKMADRTKDELTVDAAGPATPTVGLYAGETAPEKISGTWDSTTATSLKVAIPKAAIAAVLRSDPQLTSLSGVWTLHLPRRLEPGSYDVAVETADPLGRSASDQTRFEILVKEAPPPPPPYDCAGVLGQIGNVFPIRFDFDRIGLISPYDLSVNQAAALLTDARCRETRAEVTGHADYLGPNLYNQALSEKRAQVVIDMLVAAGIAPARLGIKGMSSADPADPTKGEAARAKNRRVVIRIMQ
jgi:outer membrane protein OmpA-like peptidoglycan-associated protein